MTDVPPLAAPDLRRWPSDPAQFVDATRCPACFTPLRRAGCDACGLRLDVPAAAELFAAGLRVRDAERDRQAVIGRMRAAQAQAEQARVELDRRVPDLPALIPPPLPVASVAVPSASPPAAAPAPAAQAATADTPPPPPEIREPGASTDARPRRSGVQVLLLTLGVVLLSVAAIVFLLVAYLVATLEVRSIITAAASILVLGLAWVLRARGLGGTAEGVASVAVVLLVLDGWIVRANELFGTVRLDELAYWGGALLVVAAILAIARRVSRVRVPGFAAAALAPAGAFLLGYGAAPDDEVGTAAWLGGLAAVLVGAVGQFARPSVERTIMLAAAFGAGAIALVAASWALPATSWGSTWALLGLTAAWIALLLARWRAVRTADPWTIVAAVAAGMAAALAPAVGAAIELDAAEAIWIAPAAAAGVACIAAGLTRAGATPRRHALPGLVAAAAVAAIAALPALQVLPALAVDLPAATMAGWGADATAPRESLGGMLGVDELRLGAVLAPLALAVGALIVLILLRRLRPLAALPTALALTAAVAAAIGAPTLLAVEGILLGVAIIGLAAAALRAVRSIPGVTVVLAVFGLTSASIAWVLAHASVDLWWWVVPVLVAAALCGRALARRVWSTSTTAVAAPLHTAAATVMVLFGAFALPGWSVVAGTAFPEPWSSAVFLLALAGAVLVAVPAALVRMPLPDRRAVAIPSFAAALGGSILLAAMPSLPLGWIPPAVLVMSGAAWIRSTLLSIRYAAAVIVPVSMALAAAGLVTEYGPADGGTYGTAAAALLAAVLGHVAVPRDQRTRWAWSAAVGLVAFIALVGTVVPPTAPADPWLVLLLLAPVPVLVAALDGDPIGGTAPTRHLSWLTLVLAVGSIWAWLGEEDVSEVESYTLPLAGALLAAGALIMWRGNIPETTVSGRTAVLASAAAVAVLPSVATAGDSELRTLVLVSSGTVAVLAGLFLPERARGVPVRLLAVGAGWVAVTGAGLVRGLAVALGESSRLFIEFWPLLALAVGTVAAIAWIRTQSRPTAAAESAFAGSVAAVSIPTLAAVLDDREPVLRALVLLTALALLHVANTATAARPIGGPITRWSSLGVLVLAGTLALTVGTVDPFDVVTVPVAAALIGAGALRMVRDRSVGSWPALGPGLAVLLVPALIADWTEPELWRLVALGVVSAVAVVVGAALRLQAPVLLGGAILLVHAIAQLWPYLSAFYEDVWWWLWLGIAGALLIAIAATYERQLRLARSAIRTIAGLR
ncbi:SCO7613 C-terminal domain-containing membrane protein [Agromyces sp. NPDC056523]|uniref:SCO7613 C-terminal domain-containing membrane protein n=1 Tax=Agromyces sp. NPDC056523 TaxID=3345850 RepID=UPI00366B5FE5